MGCASSLSALSCVNQPQFASPCNSNQVNPLTVIQQQFRFSSGGPSKLVVDVLHAVQVKKLKEELRDESSMKLSIGTEEFIARAIGAGAASNRDEALRLLGDLHRTGDVLHHLDAVYLRASDIAEIVQMALPGAREEARTKLGKIEEELRDLEDIYGDAEDKAKRITRRFLIAGGFILVVQFISFIWLTWFELSWDVMEPFGYIIQLFYQLVAYCYFLITNGKVFDLGPFRETWQDNFKTSIIKSKAFDEARYQYLTRLKERYQRYLNHALAEKIV